MAQHWLACPAANAAFEIMTALSDAPIVTLTRSTPAGPPTFMAEPFARDTPCR